MNKFIGISPNKSFDFDNTQSRPNEFVASVGNNSSLLVAFLIILVSHFFFFMIARATTDYKYIFKCPWEMGCQ